MNNNQQGSTQDNPTCFVQRDFLCLSGRVTLVLDTEEVCWISLPSACQLLALNVRGQLQRINRTPELESGLRQITLATRGGPQRINCLRMEFVQPWLDSLKQHQQEQSQHFFQEVTEAAKLLVEQKDSGDDQRFVEEASVQEVIREEDSVSKAVVAATLPGLGQILLVTNYPEEGAIRQATLARPDAWNKEPTRKVPYYLASNKVVVSLGDPTQPLLLEDAQEALESLQESTVLTARYIMGQWHMAREQNALAEDGSVLIRPEEILEWRDIVPHSREIYPGSQVRQIDGYEQKYLDQIHKDIKLLELFYLQAQHRLLDRLAQTQRLLNIDGPYLRVTHIQEPDSGLRVYYGAPGAWINVWLAVTEAHGGLWVAELDRRIFKLHPHNDQIALRLALYLSEHWQMHLAADLDVVPISMEALLTASLISIDRPNLTLRFAPRVEAALQKLVAEGIIGDAQPQQSFVKQGYWGKTWLAMLWEIRPPAELVKRHQSRRSSQSLPIVLLPEPTQNAAETPKRHRKEVRPIQKEEG